MTSAAACVLQARVLHVQAQERKPYVESLNVNAGSYSLKRDLQGATTAKQFMRLERFTFWRV